MGIKGFLAFLKTFPGGVSELPNEVVFDHVAIDMNGLLHRASQKSSTRDEFVMKLFSTLDRTIKAAVPRKTLILAVDGPAPAAKLEEQRRRRLTRDGGEDCSEQQPGGAVSQLELTPGTAFMAEDLDAILVSAFSFFYFARCACV